MILSCYIFFVSLQNVAKRPQNYKIYFKRASRKGENFYFFQTAKRDDLHSIASGVGHATCSQDDVEGGEEGRGGFLVSLADGFEEEDGGGGGDIEGVDLAVHGDEDMVVGCGAPVLS